MRQTWLGRCILDACLCTCRWHNRTRKCMLNEGVSTIWMCMDQMSDACLSLPWKEVHTAQDCDTNEETGHWDNSDFLTHTHTHMHADIHCPTGVETPPASSFSSTLHPSFSTDKWVSFSMTGRQRADRAWLASQTPAQKQCCHSIHYCEYHYDSAGWFRTWCYITSFERDLFFF